MLQVFWWVCAHEQKYNICHIVVRHACAQRSITHVCNGPLQSEPKQLREEASGPLCQICPCHFACSALLFAFT